MKKKLKSILGVMIICVLLLGENVVAAEVVDGSTLTVDEESLGISEIMPRGMYLQSGYSNISKTGTGSIAAGGTTNAQTKVSTVKVSVIVERYVGGNWIQYTSWSATRYDASSVTSGKTMNVPTGYYYRTRSIHSANSDMSSSQTNGLYV